MKWVKCSERLPDWDNINVIFAGREFANRESNDVNAYVEICLISPSVVRIESDEIPVGWAILENYDWLDESE